MFCIYCGNELDDDALFCTKCGKRVDEQVAEKAADALPTEMTATAAISTQSDSGTSTAASGANYARAAQASVTKAEQSKPMRKPNAKRLVIVAIVAVATLAVGISSFLFLNDPPSVSVRHCAGAI